MHLYEMQHTGRLMTITDPILENLNPEQREVVLTTEGPLLVLAGAGSGKTRCVTHRVAHLILNKHVKPWNILVVTFTNKAASELRERLHRDFSQKIKAVAVGTFHSICLRILRFKIEQFPEYTSAFSIYSRDDQVSFLKRIYHTLDIDPKELAVEKMLTIISSCKSNLILPNMFFQHNEQNAYTKRLQQVYEFYFEQLKKENVMDFDDLLLNTALLFMRNTAIKEKYQDIYKYIMIDEYQDTNQVQFQIVNLLAERHRNICVVGDDDQAIYGWRGANIKNILNFNKIYDNVKIVKLERNYRSCKNILSLANAVIAKNRGRHEKALWSDKESTAQPLLLSHDDDQREAIYIADSVAEHIQKGISPSEIVVLYRTNAQSRIFENLFTIRAIPYQIIGSFGFFKRAIIKDMLAWLRFLVNPRDTQACLRIINNPPRGIGKTSIDAVLRYMDNHDMNIMEVLAQTERLNELKQGGKVALNAFYQLILSIQNEIPNLTLAQLVKLIAKQSGINDYLRGQNTLESTDKLENIQELITAVTEFDQTFYTAEGKRAEIADYLNTLSLQSDIDEFDSDKDTVKLMTLHCVKGLEFEVVYIAGVEDGILPHVLCLEKNENVEEERRLLYVGITRAKDEVYLNYAHVRRVAGRETYQRISRFLKELTTDVVGTPFMVSASNRNVGTPLAASATNRNVGTPLAASVSGGHHKLRPYDTSQVILESQKHFKIGQKVQHSEHGKGTILNVDGADENALLTISFENGSLKKIMGKWVSDAT